MLFTSDLIIVSHVGNTKSVPEFDREHAVRMRRYRKSLSSVVKMLAVAGRRLSRTVVDSSLNKCFGHHKGRNLYDSKKGTEQYSQEVKI